MMKELFEKWFCKHTWKLDYNNRTTVYDETCRNPSKDIPIRYENTRIYICEKCGKIKKLRFNT